jgi:hypothetical protein
MLFKEEALLIAGPSVATIFVLGMKKRLLQVHRLLTPAGSAFSPLKM